LTRFQRRDFEILQLAVPDLEPVEKIDPNVTPLLSGFLPLGHEPALTSTTTTLDIYHLVLSTVRR